MIATGDIIDTTFPSTSSAAARPGQLDALNRLMDMSIHNLPLQCYADRTFLVPGTAASTTVRSAGVSGRMTIVRDRVQDLITRPDTGAGQAPTRHSATAAAGGHGSVDDGMFVGSSTATLRQEGRVSRAPSRSPRSPGCCVALAASTRNAVAVAASRRPGLTRRRAVDSLAIGPVITQDWRWRMVTLPAISGLSVDPEARIADAWDPAKTPPASSADHGAPGLRASGRLHITWQDDNTLKTRRTLARASLPLRRL